MDRFTTLFILSGTTEIIMNVELPVVPNKGNTVRLIDTDFTIVNVGYNIIDDDTADANQLPHNIVGVVVEVEPIKVK